MTSALLQSVDPARMLDAIEAQCRSETRTLYTKSGVDREIQLAVSGQADTVPTGEGLTYFHSRVLPGASLRSLAASIVRAGVAVDVTTVAIAATLMVRFTKRQELTITAHMMHRLFVTCVLIAAKVHQDKFPCNKLLGKAVGITLSEMNRLETALTTSLDWRFVVTQKDLLEAMASLVPSKAVAGLEGDASDSYIAGDARSPPSARKSAEPCAVSTDADYV